jgi:hypothetical protein
MARMTEEEAWALDEYWTEHTPKLSGNGNSGFFAKHREKGSTLVFLDTVSAAWLHVRAEATHKTSTKIIGELVRKEIAAAGP